MFVYICQSAVVAAPYYRKRADALPQLRTGQSQWIDLSVINQVT